MSPLLTPREVAAIFGVKSLKTISRWRRDGRLPFVKTPGGHYRYREEDVRRLRGEANMSERAQDLEAHVMAQREAARFRDRM